MKVNLYDNKNETSKNILTIDFYNVTYLFQKLFKEITDIMYFNPIDLRCISINKNL